MASELLSPDPRLEAEGLQRACRIEFDKMRALIPPLSSSGYSNINLIKPPTLVGGYPLVPAGTTHTFASPEGEGFPTSPMGTINIFLRMIIVPDLHGVTHPFFSIT